ncbi:MAG: M23 family metallopeptidase, partial [Alphaproteobacteria bacterium]|nr:M23 family metallopeptidase [Alphaproteobacteria bacterium]
MSKSVLKICIFILTAFIGMSAFDCSVYANENQSCSKDCGQIEKCKPARNGTIYKQSASSNVINGKCVKEKTANGCYDSNPTSCSGSYKGLGNRTKKGGGLRNHLGSDIGSAACGAAKGRIQVYAPADGTIVWTGVSTGGGRTMVIEHERKCAGGGKYKTIFRHLAAYIKTGGSVKKNVPVGIEGGSNCYDKNAGDACICDNTEQSVGKVYSGCSKINAYAIHLHIETVNSGFNSSNYIGKEVENVLQSSCGEIQTLCGGCAIDTTSCGGKMEMTSDGTVASMDGIEGGSEGGDFGADGSGEYKSDKCDFKEYLDSQNCTFCEV